jgi:hypothetical protein
VGIEKIKWNLKSNQKKTTKELQRNTTSTTGRGTS